MTPINGGKEIILSNKKIGGTNRNFHVDIQNVKQKNLFDQYGRKIHIGYVRDIVCKKFQSATNWQMPIYSDPNCTTPLGYNTHMSLWNDNSMTRHITESDVRSNYGI